MSQTSHRLALFGLIVVCGCHTSARGQMPTTQLQERREERVAKAKEMLSYMNFSADPCNDFFDFACGNWKRYQKTTLANEGDLISAQSQLELRVNRELQIILEERISAQDSASARKIKDFYKACTTTDSSSPLQHEFIVDFVKKHGGLPYLQGTKWHMNYNWVEIVATLRANYGLDILIGLEIDNNMMFTMRRNSIFLTEPKSTLLPVELCSSIATQQVFVRDRVYDKIQLEVAENLQSWFELNKGDASRLAGDIVRFEFELCKHMRKEHTWRPGSQSSGEESRQRTNQGYRTGQNRLHGVRQQNVQYPPRSLQQLTQQFGNAINFKEFVDISLDTSVNDQVFVRSEAYFNHLAHIARTSPRPSLANYIMYRALSEINFPRGDSRSLRPKYCVDLVLHYFPKVIGDLYNRKFIRSDTRNDIEFLYRAISKTFEESLKADWIDENTRRAIRQKLSQFRIAFPIYQSVDLDELHIAGMDYWHKLEQVMRYKAKEQLNRVHFGNARSNVVEAPAVRMELSPTDNEIQTGWGLLQQPYYYYYYPNALKYSQLGQHMARELVKAFDEQGWNQNPLSPMRWDNFTAEGFHSRSECFRIKFSNFLYNNPEMFRNASKLRELIAESSGLNIAFNAYLAWLSTIDPSNRFVLSKETLPDFNFSNTQLFFIHFAQTRCAVRHKESPPPDYLPMDRHTVERYDVNGPLSNNAEFAREFGCAIGTEMNQDDKCVIY